MHLEASEASKVSDASMASEVPHFTNFPMFLELLKFPRFPKSSQTFNKEGYKIGGPKGQSQQIYMSNFVAIQYFLYLFQFHPWCWIFGCYVMLCYVMLMQVSVPTPKASRILLPYILKYFGKRNSRTNQNAHTKREFSLRTFRSTSERDPGLFLS